MSIAQELELLKLKLAQAEQFVAVRLAVNPPLIPETIAAQFRIHHRQQEMLLHNEGILVPAQVDVGHKTLYAIFALKPFRQVAE